MSDLIERTEVDNALFGQEIIIMPKEYLSEPSGYTQARSHRKKRINKKWLKRYGTKAVYPENKVLYMESKIYMTQKTFERLFMALR